MRDVREAVETAGCVDCRTVAIRGRQQFASVIIAYLQVACDDGWLKDAVRRTFYKVIFALSRLSLLRVSPKSLLLCLRGYGRLCYSSLSAINTHRYYS